EMSREGYIVRDADRLDAIGAIGIARTFQFAGHFNEPMWVGEIPDNISGEYDLDDYSPSAIKHFYDKLFKLKDLMHTETAQAIAEERHRFMEYFVAQFFKEWDFTN
ncbi:HD domain-containing protein, partial [Staphylococcus condimenti]